MSRRPVREFIVMSLAAGAGVVGGAALTTAQEDLHINQQLYGQGEAYIQADTTTQAEYRSLSDRSDKLLLDAIGLGILACGLAVSSLTTEVRGHLLEPKPVKQPEISRPPLRTVRPTLRQLNAVEISRPPLIPRSVKRVQIPSEALPALTIDLSSHQLTH